MCASLRCCYQRDSSGRASGNSLVLSGAKMRAMNCFVRLSSVWLKLEQEAQRAKGASVSSLLLQSIHCAVIRYCQSDSVRYILNVAARPAPARLFLFEQDSGSAVVHTLQITEQAMLRIAHAIDCGKS